MKRGAFPRKGHRAPGEDWAARFTVPGDKTLALACSQLGVVLASGLPLAGAVRLVAAQTGAAGMRRILWAVAEDLTAGSTLTAALERWSMLPPLLIETVRAGEESGALADSFRELGSHFAGRAELKQKVSAALSYPALLIAAAIVVMAVILIRLVPALTGVFAGLGGELPPATRMLMGLSRWLGRGWPLITALLGAAALGLLLLNTGRRGKLLLGRLRLALPLVGSFDTLKNANRFAATMSTLLRAGLPVTRALRTTAGVMTNAVIAREVQDCLRGIEEGRELSECLARSGHLPPLLGEMAGVGEETRTLAETFSVAADYFEKELKNRAERAVRALEPITVAAVAAFALFLLMAVYTPILSIYGSF